jgi:hypothetical protein
MKEIDLIREMFSLKKVLKTGGSYALLLPRDWVDIYCDEIDGDYWVEAGFNGKEITLTAISQKDFERLSSMIQEAKR